MRSCATRYRVLTFSLTFIFIISTIFVSNRHHKYLSLILQNTKLNQFLIVRKHHLTLSVCNTLTTINPTAVTAAMLNPVLHQEVLSRGKTPSSCRFLEKKISSF